MAPQDTLPVANKGLEALEKIKIKGTQKWN